MAKRDELKLSSVKRNEVNKPTEMRRSQKSQVVRLPPEQAMILGELSVRFGVSQAQLMRWAVDAMAEKVRQSGGKIVLPLVFDLPEDRK